MKNFIKLFLICIAVFGLLLPGYSKTDPDKLLMDQNSLYLPEYQLEISNPYFSENIDDLSGEVELGLMNIQLDVLGFIFFGPLLQYDFQFADFISVGPYVRWNYAGLLYQGFITDWFTDSQAGIASFGVGVSTKILPPIGNGMHRPYINLGFERFRGEEWTEPGGTWGNHIWEYKSNVYSFGFGYRFISSGGFNMSAGIMFAISQETENIDYYEYGDEPIDHNTLNTRVFGGVQLIMGYQFVNF